MIELKDICKSYYGQGIENKVLRHIDFKIEAGEFVMLYGESGSGKTTLLNIIGLLDPCTSGQVLLDGRTLQTLPGMSRRNCEIRLSAMCFSLSI